MNLNLEQYGGLIRKERRQKEKELQKEYKDKSRRY